jgi:uncharacterized protein YjbI with pentapeptide repeats
VIDRPPHPADEVRTDAKQHHGAWKRVGDRLLARSKQHRRAWQGVDIGLLALGLLVLLLACVLWIPRWLYPALTDSDLRDVRTAENQPDAAKVQELKGARLKLQNDARTTLLQGLGALLVLTGAGIGAAMTLQQVKVSQDGLKVTRVQMQRTSETTRQQLSLAEQGHITDLYTRAVEQLGHEKAPVRLGALYSLVRLAQDNPDYRQTVVDVVCAYLRMPIALPPRNEPGAEQVEEVAPSADGQDRARQSRPAYDPSQEELQVRRSAQRLLADHLRRPPETSGQDAQLLPPSPQQDFWPGISLELTGATLIDFTFEQVSVIKARFYGATFQGTTWFRWATFQEIAGFDEVTFYGHARFDEATFQGTTRFDRAAFQRTAAFRKADFQRSAQFHKTTFQDNAYFYEATFHGNALFDGATFQAIARFDPVIFHGNAQFMGATFQDTALFDGATFQGTTWFHKVTFQGAAQFNGATIHGTAWLNEAQVLHLIDVPDRDRVWPDGWTVRRDPADRSRGTLVRTEQTDEPQSAVAPPLTGSNTQRRDTDQTD